MLKKQLQAAKAFGASLMDNVRAIEANNSNRLPPQDLPGSPANSAGQSSAGQGLEPAALASQPTASQFPFQVRCWPGHFTSMVTAKLVSCDEPGPLEPMPSLQEVLLKAMTTAEA